MSNLEAGGGGVFLVYSLDIYIYIYIDWIKALGSEETCISTVHNVSRHEVYLQQCLVQE